MMKRSKTLNPAAGAPSSYRWLGAAVVRAIAVIFCVMTAVFSDQNRARGPGENDPGRVQYA